MGQTMEMDAAQTALMSGLVGNALEGLGFCQMSATQSVEMTSLWDRKSVMMEPRMT